MTPIPDAPIWLLLPGLAAAGAAALRYRSIAVARAKRIKALEATIEDREQAIRMRDAEARHLVEHRVPALMKGLWQGQPTEAPGLLHDELAGTPFAQAQYTVLEMFGGVPAEASERAESAARAAVRTVTRSMEALLNEQQRAILDMLERHHDAKVLHDANAIDHASSQLSRRTQVIGVLTGSRPLRQRTNSPLEDVVRGGISRIRDYQRVKVTGRPAAAVVSRVVEPVVLAVAELLDNAARHSEPGSDVRVWFVEGHNGVSIVIDDAGVGLKPEDRELAGRQLSGREPVLLTQLRNPPKFGFSAVGVLAARYGFRASVEQESDYGGVRAVVYLPKDLLTTDTDPQPAATRARPAPAETGLLLTGDSEPVRAEPVRAEPVRAEPVRAEPVRAEAGPESVGPVSAAAEPARAEPVSVEPGPVSAEPGPASAGSGLAPAGGVSEDEESAREGVAAGRDAGEAAREPTAPAPPREPTAPAPAPARDAAAPARDAAAPARDADTTAHPAEEPIAPEEVVPDRRPRLSEVTSEPQSAARAREFTVAEPEPESAEPEPEPAEREPESVERESGVTHAPQPAVTPEPSSDAAPTAPAAAGPSFPLRPDGLPQRRRNQPRRPAAPSRPAMQTPSNPAGSVGAVVRGRRRAAQRQQDQNERNPES
ncbi:ATP-binding protein [Streptomyces sp. NPDC048639]|uniref:ATP-binding protein n=1 Tax=Streptomyces sp. NPDC048639 TaxID=3365581 RepID=UPI00372341FC